jgi:UDP-N-acetylmuramate dehydrogenase
MRLCIVKNITLEILENIALAPLTTLKLGGPARYFAEARNLDEVQQAVAFAQERSLPLFVLGGGSNLVVSDAGWPGLVLKIAITGIELRADSADGKVRLAVGAGESWDKFVSHAVMADCAGVECLSGIPGSVGGTPVQNVGAYGQEVAETIAAVLALDLRDGRVREMSNAACGFQYRTSIFNTTERGRYIILQVTFALIPGGKAHVVYDDLKKHFAGWQTDPSLMETREAVRHIRGLKGMLIVPGDPECQSAGSFFKNPIVSEMQLDDLKQRAAQKRLALPSYPGLQSSHKVSAAWLVEHSGFAKGHGFGNVGISRKHALALVNRGGATAAQLLALKDEIQNRVEALWGVRLETEPVMV